MEPISAIIALVGNVITRVFPDKTEAGRAQVEIIKLQMAAELQKELAQSDLLRGQIEINKAEAENPNRKWVSWRELLGYVLVLALSYQWFVLPVLSLLAQAVSHPLDLNKLYTVDILDVLMILGGMLGIDLGPSIANKFRGIKK